MLLSTFGSKKVPSNLTAKTTVLSLAEKWLLYFADCCNTPILKDPGHTFTALN